MSKSTGTLLLTLITFWFHLFMLIYSMDCCSSSFQNSLFLVDWWGWKSKGRKSQLSHTSQGTGSGGEGWPLPWGTAWWTLGMSILNYFMSLLFSSNPKEPWQVICDNFSRDVNLNHGLCETGKKKSKSLTSRSTKPLPSICSRVYVQWSKRMHVYVFINMGYLKVSGVINRFT